MTARIARRHLLVAATVALAACGSLARAQTAATAPQTAPVPQEQVPPGAGTAAPASTGLSDLDAMTFGCPRAGLNAAAREAAKVPSQGTYQFAYFRMISDSHHALYEVHFKSNYVGEADLKYCVALYCQQGWDPKTTKTTVTLMTAAGPKRRGTAHGADCGLEPAPAKRRTR